MKKFWWEHIQWKANKKFVEKNLNINSKQLRAETNKQIFSDGYVIEIEYNWFGA